MSLSTLLRDFSFTELFFFAHGVQISPSSTLTSIDESSSYKEDPAPCTALTFKALFVLRSQHKNHPVSCCVCKWLTTLLPQLREAIIGLSLPGLHHV